MPKHYTSRLARKESRRNLRQAVLFGVLTVLMALVLVFLGIPILIRMAIFLGNLRGTYTPVENQDIISPSAPSLRSTSEATTSAQIELKGFTEPGTTVAIFLNGSVKEKTVGESDGSFLISNLVLSSGTNEIYATATDEAGNQSQKSATLLIIFDNEPPPLSITQPGDETFFPHQQTVLNIEGKTENGATLTINEHLVIVDSQGKFSYPLALTEGENKIKITATDRAGNQTEKELTVKRE